MERERSKNVILREVFIFVFDMMAEEKKSGWGGGKKRSEKISNLTINSLPVVMMKELGILLLMCPHETTCYMRKRLMCDGHVVLSHLQCLNEHFRSTLEIFQWHTAGVLTRNRHSLKVGNEVMLVDRECVVGIHLRCK